MPGSECLHYCRSCGMLLVWRPPISGPRKENQWTDDGVTGDQGSLMHMGSEGWPCGLIQYNNYCSSNCWKQMLALTERCQGCCEWGCVDWSGRPCWPVSTTKSACNGHMSIRTGPQSDGGRWSGLMISFISWLDVCASLTWGRDGSWMHYGKKVSWQWQCDALGNVLLGTPWVLTFMWMLLWHVT